MKKFKKIGYIFIIIIAIVLAFSIYKSIAKDSKTDIKDKTFSEIKYFESKILYMFNALNNIEFENYKISIEDISEKSKKSSKSSSSAGNGGDSSSGSEESGSSSKEGESGQSESSINETKKFSLNMQGVLTANKEINWQYIKNEAEMVQNSISTMVLDLYEIGLNNNDILNFSKEYDNMLVSLKNEDKENTLKQLNTLYSYIPKFIKNCNVEEQYKIVVDTKQNIFNAYSILDSEEWNKINNYLQTANATFSELLTNVNLKNKNQYTVNKCYIDLNSLQNSVETKDKEIFLIKYRCLLEDLNNL